MRSIVLACILVTMGCAGTSASNAGDATIMNNAFAQTFASEWIHAWNSHDLEKILEYYEDDFEMSSPLIITLMNEPSGKLKGKRDIGRYWETALARAPKLHFELVHTVVGANSLIIVYEGARGLAAEYFQFSPNGKVALSAAHYLGQ